jgi:hypothetical protein
MNEQNLKQWLQASDSAAGEPMMPPLDEGHLQRLMAHRRVRRRGFAAMGVATAVAAIALWGASPDQTETRVASPPKTADIATTGAEARMADEEASRAELDSLQREIDERKALVAALREADELERLNRELAELEEQVPSSLMLAPIQVEQARSQAAAVSLQYANLLANEFREDELAAAEYTTIVSRYPGTAWSTAAEQAIQSAARNL